MVKSPVSSLVRGLLYSLFTLGALLGLAYFTWDSVVPCLAEIAVVLSLISLFLNGLLALITFAIKQKIFSACITTAIVSIGIFGAAFIYLHEASVFQDQAFKKAESFQLAVSPLLEKYHQDHGQYPGGLEEIAGIPPRPQGLSYHHESKEDRYLFFFNESNMWQGGYAYSSNENEWAGIGD